MLQARWILLKLANINKNALITFMNNIHMHSSCFLFFPASKFWIQSTLRRQPEKEDCFLQMFHSQNTSSSINFHTTCIRLAAIPPE